MKKEEFLRSLKHSLSSLPKKERGEQLAFYSEMIDDRIEEGLSEEKAVAEIGSVEQIKSQILSNIPTKEKPVKERKTWQTVLLIIGSPLWLVLLLATFIVALSLVISAVAVILSLLISLWSVIASLWVVFVSLIVASIGGILISLLYIILGHFITGFALIGCSISCGGLAIFLFYGCKYSTLASAKLSKLMAKGLKKLFVKRRK